LCVAGEQRGVERFGEGDVDGVVGGEVFAQRPDAIEERLVRVSFDVERTQVHERDERGVGVDLAEADVATHGLRDLDVEQMWRMQRTCRVSDVRGYGRTARRSQEQLDDGGGVEDDHRASRSERTTSAGRCL